MATCDNKVSLNHNDEMNLKYYNKFKNVHVHKIQSKVVYIAYGWKIQRAYKTFFS